MMTTPFGSRRGCRNALAIFGIKLIGGEKVSSYRDLNGIPLALKLTASD